MPLLSTGRYTISNPCSSKYFIVAATEECSIFVVIILFPALLFALALPIIARLFDSVPPDVKYISFGSVFNIFDIFSLACLIYFSAFTPTICIDDGFP